MELKKIPLRRPRLGAAVYVLPNLLTTGNLFFGFLSIIKSLEGQYYLAAGCIFLASIFDVLDGRVARLTGGTSEFGVQYDSLCDLLSFGMAPSFMAFHFSLIYHGRLGWVFCFLFLACGALRLARFNVQSSIGQSSGDFTGLPIPMAAAVVASYIALRIDIEKSTYDSMSMIMQILVIPIKEALSKEYFLVAAVPLLALAMVSNFAYQSHKMIKFQSLSPFKILVIGVISVSVLAYEPHLILFMLCFVYAISGPIAWAVGWKKAHEDRDIFESHGEDDSIMEPHDGDGDGGGGVRK